MQATLRLTARITGAVVIQKISWTGAERRWFNGAMMTLPTQLVEWRCDLEAVDDGWNIARAYSVSVTQDLFGQWIVDLRWGRIGTLGTGLKLTFESDSAARRLEHVLWLVAHPRPVALAFHIEAADNQGL